MFRRTNVEEKLRHHRDKHYDERDIMDTVYRILQSETEHNKRIEEVLTSGNSAEKNDFVFDLLETDKIYHIDQIQKICIDYRLRFLDTKYFKGTFPKEAITAIRDLEEQHDTSLNGLKIIAPSRLFKLENADDPLLFASIGNNYYYLIHKWGNDLHPLRKLLVLPFKNFLNLCITVLLISWLLTALIPLDLFVKDHNSTHFWLIYLFMFKMVGSLVIFYGVALGKNFNHAIWKSKYYNA
ncbi:hypothetical protein OOZ15_12825 [Galbibacter sp. EGI 63066]|uniref:hypothetical protein n=1 Tax=Galbibacter sp. EGI 63066 TaxID=2993559 RepID=UPI00224980F2|nr:hypothetical protein [Galbibacter sp. EGI 63066]MCX2680830.1 hypothetical protein [Galbibacter sp. EGI 63066]